MKIFYLLIGFLAIAVCACTPDPPSNRSKLKIVLIGPLPIESSDEMKKIPEKIRELCAVLLSNSDTCNRTCILDPSLFRLDINKEISLKTTIEKGGAKVITSPKVIGKLIQKNFEDLNVPKEFFQVSALGDGTHKLFNEFVNTKSGNDSILVYFSESSVTKSYALNGRDYEIFTDVSEIRKYLLDILCQNDKANFTLLINPPVTPISPPLALKITDTNCQTGKLIVQTTGGDGSPITFSAAGLSKEQRDNEFTIPELLRKGKTFTFTATQSGKLTKVDYTTECPITQPDHPGGHKKYTSGGRTTSVTGDLTIIKGSEGCDICTRYYSATDNLGHVRQVTQRNSTECCPCGKTIEMRGRTYRMDCDGAGSNRLALVE